MEDGSSDKTDKNDQTILKMLPFRSREECVSRWFCCSISILTQTFMSKGVCSPHLAICCNTRGSQKVQVDSEPHQVPGCRDVSHLNFATN